MALIYRVPAKPSRPFVVGDLVDVMDSEAQVLSTRRVVRAGKYTCKTNCGRTWMQTGWFKATNGVWPFPWIRHSRRKRATQ